MFILRRITSESNEINEILGDSYSLILRERHNKEYERTLLIQKWDKNAQLENLYGFIVHNNGQKVIPLYKKSHYFIMTSDGKTFSNITFK